MVLVEWWLWEFFRMVKSGWMKTTSTTGPFFFFWQAIVIIVKVRVRHSVLCVCYTRANATGYEYLALCVQHQPSHIR